MNSINWPAPSIWVFIAQLGEHCSANAEATGSKLINLQNTDAECFRWCHIRHLNPQDKDPQQIKKSDRQYIPNLDYTEIEFPVTIKQFNRIEKQNRINISVFGYEEKQPFPIYVSKEKFEDHMDLLLITEGENKHYVLIKDFNKFMYNLRQTQREKTLLPILPTVL